MKKALADVLWDAANKHLSTTQHDGSTTSEYSCWAVDHAVGSHTNATRAYKFLRDLGCETCVVHDFDMVGDRAQERQGVRYMWFLLAMHVAEDESIYIEVS